MASFLKLAFGFHTNCGWLSVFAPLKLGGPDALAVCWALRGLPVGFLFLRYSVSFTVDPYLLLYLLVIS